MNSNKINYDSLMQAELEKIDINRRPQLLLHSCCAPCSSSVILRLKNYFKITILYYNPNIEPIEEYLKRKEEQIKLINILGDIGILDTDYENDDFKEKIIGLENEAEGGKRCEVCILNRLEYTAKCARENDFDYFGTTLTVSPHKNSNYINEIGILLEEKYQIKFLKSDFKKREGYKKSIQLSKEYGLYRQDYCGCIYSIKSRLED